MLARAFCSLRPIVRRTQLDGQPRQSLIQPPREPPSEINVGGVRTSPGVVSWPWTSASRGSPTRSQSSTPSAGRPRITPDDWDDSCSAFYLGGATTKPNNLVNR